MSKEELEIRLSPKEILHLLEDKIKRLNRVHREFYTLEKNHALYVIMYEFMFLRNGSTGTITLLMEDQPGWTTVKVIAAGARGGFHTFDDDLTSEEACLLVKKILHEHIITQKNLF